MKNTMGIIYHHNNEEALGGLTSRRSLASVPYGGNYRLIDFTLSNMVNAGIGNIAVITAHNLRSLVDHLGSGREWGLDRKKDGLFILPTCVRKSAQSGRIVDLEDLFANLDYLHRSMQKYVLLAGSDVVSNIDLNKVLAFHQEKNAQITFVYQSNYPLTPENYGGEIILRLDGDLRVAGISREITGKVLNNVALHMFLLEKSFLLDILEESTATGQWDLVGEVLSDHLQDWRIYGYPHDGYAAVITSVDSYFSHQMDLLTPEIWRDLFRGAGGIRTKIKDGPPAKYADGAYVYNTLVSNGCLLEGRVENSILFRGVKIAKGAVVKNSIVMTSTIIDEGAFVDYAILDKDVHVGRGARVMGEEGIPLVVEKRSVI